ncbi:uncharacterized protein LOC131687095 [Topomyia yanbarensis]|uniref:uncharacterized protein LOC131687095 n=1 Tax=Topomyia yanbarensis TaxID=2498891 RepID=UPI00273C8891|nr:uncharacterized protein LOC131687095 [Topomyia yanbarensis]
MPSDLEATSVSYSCKGCEQVDDSRMVACDKCNSWWHYQCASVNDSISEKDFVCKICSEVLHSVIGSSTTSTSRTRMNLRRLAEQKALMERQIELEQRDQQRRHEQERLQKEGEIERKKLELDKRFSDEMYRVLDLEADGENDDQRSNKSQQSSISKVNEWRWERHLGGEASSTMVTVNPETAPRPAMTTTAAERGYVDQNVPIQQKNPMGGIINRSSMIPLEPPRTKCSQGSGLHNDDIARNDEPRLRPAGNVPGRPYDQYRYPGVQATLNPHLVPRSFAENFHSFMPHSDPYMAKDAGQHAGFQIPMQQPGPSFAFPSQHTHYNQPLPQGWGTAPQQLAARQVMPKELPVFSGNPEDWPLFISSYATSTQACGYTDAENLIRLQRSLRGHALEAVRSRLLLPASVPQVIATLQVLYGRPELLIHTLLKKLRDIPSPKPEKLDTLISFGMAVQNLCDHLVAGNQDAHLNNPTLLYELVEKLPAHLKLDWAMYKRQFLVADLRIFAQYMTTIVSAASEVTLYVDSKQVVSFSKQERAEKKNLVLAHTGEPQKKNEPIKDESEVATGKQCPVCRNPGHRVKECEVFQKMEVDDRWKVSVSHSLCRCCLFAHGRRPCKTKSRCGINDCEYRHHPLLHFITKKNELNPANGNAKVNNHHQEGRSSLFRIVPVTLRGKNRILKTFAFLDDGSSITLVENSIAEQLGAKGESDALCLTWTANVKRIEEDSKRIDITISGSQVSRLYTISNARTVQNLDLPIQSLQYSELAIQYPHLQGLPIEDYVNVTPRILIGIDNAHLAVPLKTREGKLGDPIATKTRLGWSVHGSTKRSAMNNYSLHMCECSEDTSKLHELVKQYFSVESLGISLQEAPDSKDNQRALSILQNTTKRIGTRYETGLLWKYDHIELPDSFGMAFKRLQCLERRMKADPVIGDSVIRQISEYQRKGYIHLATSEELDDADPRRIWYLPLGVTVNPKKPGKIRIFCDAAATVDGISLNSFLLKGPDLLVSLPAVLSGFRERKVAICADIQEMFHQIAMKKEDRHAQRILWRNDPSEPPQVFLMDVATFGSTSSPCSAQYVKNANAREHADKYPRAAEAIERKHYVDDYLDSVDSVSEAVKRAEEVKYIHSCAGFKIHSWLSNSEEVLKRVGETEPANEKNIVVESSTGIERILGMQWLPKEDIFTYTAAIALPPGRPTKREVLRTVMRIFDPLGLLSHLIVHGKILIQDIWRSKTGWDDPIPEALTARWHKWTELLSRLDQTRIPRCYFPGKASTEIESLQLHVFVDASESAYACVAYFRAVVSGQIQCALVAGKSKVAPLKILTIPKLELQAAVIGARLLQTISSSCSLSICQRFIWTDSRTVLSWIISDQRIYRQFVSVRVGEILNLTNPTEWRWIASKQNVADEATKWGLGPNLMPEGRWCQGPKFLFDSQNAWPTQPNVVADTLEERRVYVVHHQDPAKFIMWDRFSQWTKLVRSVGYIYRYVGNLRGEHEAMSHNKTMLSQKELAAAEMFIFRQIQGEAYSREVAVLTSLKESKLAGSPREFESNSKLKSLSPFFDEQGVLRMESRLSEAAFASYDMKYPIILPRDHRVTILIVAW